MARPTKKTEEMVDLLVRALEDGATIREACDTAGIDKQTYYNWLNDDEVFSTKMETARNWTTEIARANLSKKIQKGDIETSKWWLERKAKGEFSLRNELSGPEGKDLLPNPILGGTSQQPVDSN